MKTKYIILIYYQILETHSSVTFPKIPSLIFSKPKLRTVVSKYKFLIAHFIYAFE